MKKHNLVLLATLLLFPAPAFAVDVWEKNGHKFMINGDIHFGLFVADIVFNSDYCSNGKCPDQDRVSVKAKAEIDFDFRGKLGKTFSYGAKVEVRPDVDGVEVDEYYGFVKDKRYGALYFGTTKSPAGKRAVIAPNFYPKDIKPVNGASFVPLKRIERAKNETDIDYDEDVHKVIYYTPRIAGFELGVSYAPDIGTDGKGDRYNAYNNGGRTPSRNSAGHKHAISTNLNIEVSLAAVALEASVGYLTARGVSQPDSGDPTKTLNAWNVGVGLSVPINGAGELKIGGGYLRSKNAYKLGTREEVFIGGFAHKIGKFTYGVHYRYAKRAPAPSAPTRDSNGVLNISGLDTIDNELEFGGHYAFNQYLSLSSGVELLHSRAAGQRREKGAAFQTIFTFNF